MNNLNKIKELDESQMIKFLNLIINEGNHLISDDLWNSGIKEDPLNNDAEVRAWLQIDSLDKFGY